MEWIDDGGVWSANALDSTRRTTSDLPYSPGLSATEPGNERPQVEMWGTPRKYHWEVTETLEIFEEEWALFIDGASKEWTTMNIVSALLLRCAQYLTLGCLYHERSLICAPMYCQCGTHLAPNGYCRIQRSHSDIRLSFPLFGHHQSHSWVFIHPSIQQYEDTEKSGSLGRGK
jgi:hypothetical protein